MHLVAAAFALFAGAGIPADARYTPGKGLGVVTRDGRFAFGVRARLQPRLEAEHAAGEATAATLMLRRARLTLAGHVGSPRVRYYVQLGFTPRDMTGGLRDDVAAVRHDPLRDARVEFTHLRDAELWVGQMKVPFSRERLISDANLAAIDRSIVNEEFNLDRDIGVQLRSRDLGGHGGRFGYALGVFTGDGRNTFELRTPRFAYVARLELRPLGSMGTDGESDQPRSRSPRLAIGLAYAFHDGAAGDRGVFGARPSDGGTTDNHSATVDVAMHWRGVSLEGGALWRVGRREPGAAGPIEAARSGLGWFVQLAWLLPTIPLEPVLRYAQVANVYGRRSSLDEGREASGGLGWYFAGPDLELRTDYTRLWEDGCASDRLRVQLQVAF